MTTKELLRKIEDANFIAQRTGTSFLLPEYGASCDCVEHENYDHSFAICPNTETRIFETWKSLRAAIEDELNYELYTIANHAELEEVGCGVYYAHGEHYSLRLMIYRQ